MAAAAAAASVKDEPETEYVVDVCVKIESEVDEEPEHLVPEPVCAQQEPGCVKPENQGSWQDNGLYADHEVKEELVLGPELLQQLCAGKGSETAPCEAAARSSAAQGTKPRRRASRGAEHPAAVHTYMCDACGKLFKEKNSLTRHIKAHLLRNPKMLPKNFSKKAFSCKLCNKRFFQSSHLYRHVRTHNAGAKHACDICRKEFTREESLRIHQRIHTGLKPYSCEYCGKEFTQSHNLTRHLRVHTGEKPYECDICSKRCSQSGDLKTHKKIHGVFTKNSAPIKHRRNHRRKNSRKTSKKSLNFLASEISD